MSQHLVALVELERERLALIDQFAVLIEEAVERAVDAQVAAMSAAELGKARTWTAPNIVLRPTSRPPRAMPILPAMPTRIPTAIPANVTITRLPPGPSPHDRRRSAPPMDCRLPGCLMRSRGPRYEYFCDDHFRQLTPDERRHWAEVWRTNRGHRSPPMRAD